MYGLSMPSVDDQCKLLCKADGHNFFYTMSTEVTDGTTCNDFTTDICVQGKCKVWNNFLFTFNKS